jgi:hypothetical protein
MRYRVTRSGLCTIVSIWMSYAEGNKFQLRASPGITTYIFIASSCSFLGMISSMKGVNKGYIVVICVLIARCTEDLTLDFDPGEIL